MKFKISFSQKMLFMSIIGIFVMALSGFILLLNEFKYEESIKKDQLLSTTNNLSGAIQDQFYERYGDVKAFSMRFTNAQQTRAENENYLNQYATMYGIYDIILLTDLKGKVLGVNTIGPDGKPIASKQLYETNFSHEDWFKGTIERKYTEDKEKGFENVYLQDAKFNSILNTVYGKPTYASIFSTLVYNESGQVQGVITNFANFKWIEALFIRTYEIASKKGAINTELNMLDKNGNILIDYDPQLKNYDKNVAHDENILNKVNLANSGNEAAKNVLNGSDGVIEVENKFKNRQQVSAYAPVIGPKIVDSIGWKLLVQENKSDFYKNINDAKKMVYSIFLIVLATMSTIVFFFARGLANKIIDIGMKLSKGSRKLLEAATSMSASSQQLSSSTIQQAAALQQTVAAVTEINSMLKRSSETAEKSKHAAEESTVVIEQGKEYVEELKNVMMNIKRTNTDVFNQVDEGNKKISEIVQVITEIENKTKIINEIVFQTKLLSFNAAVEAARAGEQGKGFAVVAEEVGNLAQMSGQASKEISSMLEQSTNKVKSIINTTSERVSKMIQNSSEIINQGERATEKCAHGFELIASSSKNINSLIVEISNSTIEQAKGIQEINQAMHELDSITHQNSVVAQDASESSTSMLDQSHILKGISESLSPAINGNRKDSNDDYNNDNFEQGKTHESSKSKSTPKQRSNSRQNQEKSNQSNKGNNADTKSVPSNDDPRFEDL